MRLKISRVSQGIEAVLELNIAERRAIPGGGSRTIYRDLSVSELELGTIVHASSDAEVERTTRELQAACLVLKREVDARPGTSEKQVYDFDDPTPSSARDRDLFEVISDYLRQPVPLWFTAAAMLVEALVISVIVF